ncbi:MAG: FMN-binding protein [Candidatus Gracilibacteria bacterium]|nr:FMN-binding protein [Candidatus Gracilibacteria bacterium]
MKVKNQISALTLLSIVVLLSACTKVDNTTQNATTPATETPAPLPVASEYKDGTYLGTGKYIFGKFTVDYTVSLTIASGKISKASFVNFTDSGNGLYARAQGDATLQKLVGTSNRTIDTVTGATGTSVAIQDAINDALSQAKN